MSNFWRNLSDREQVFVLAGGAVLALFIVVQFVIAPLIDWRSNQLSRVSQAESGFDLVVEAASRAGAASPGNKDLDTPVRNAVSQTASSGGVNLVFVNQRPDGSVEASLEDADPNALFDWLVLLDNRYGVKTVTADIAREQGDETLVQARLTFSRDR